MLHLIHLFSIAGGRIDHGHHAGQAVRALNDAVAMAKACGKANEMTSRGKNDLQKYLLLKFYTQ